MSKVKWLFTVCFVAVFVCFGESDIKARNYTEDGFGYIDNGDGTVSIDGYIGKEEIITTPSEIEGKPVRFIKDFGGNSVKNLVISEGVSELKRSAFYGCHDIETVSLPSTLKIIGYGAFERCYRLREINLPDGLASIGAYAFYCCDKLEKLIIPDSVVEIGKDAFSINNYDRIPIYANPDSYAKIYADADPYITFSCINHSGVVKDPAYAPTCTQDGRTEGIHCPDCDIKFVEQSIINATGHSWNAGIITHEPNAVTAGVKTFTCTVCGDTKAELVPKTSLPDSGNVISDSSDSYKVTKSGLTIGTVEYTASKSSKSSITVPNTVTISGVTYKVTSIARNAFKNNKNLKKITISGNVTKINEGAFTGCKNLKTITIKSKNIKSVGKNAFKGINPKAKIKVPSSRLSKYKKLFAGKGQKSTVKIIK